MADRPQSGVFTEDAPAQSTGAFTEVPTNPDLTTQDSHSYAGSVASQKIRDLAAMAPTAQPTVEKLWEFYDKAYSDAENFKKSQTEAALAQMRQQQQKVWELTPQKGGLSPIQVEAAQRAQIEQAAAQKKEGPSAAAASQAQGGAFIQRESKDYGDKISAIAVDFDGIDRLSKLHDQMTASSPIGTGGFLKSAFGHTREAAINMSQDARNYFQLADLLTPTFGKGIQGDLPAATTKANIIEMMDKNVIPNEIDNPQSAHNKWFNLYNQAYNVLLKTRDQMKTEGQDPTRANDMLVDANKWLTTHKDWDPVRSQPLVQSGTSPQTNQVVNEQVNAAIGAQQNAQAAQQSLPPGPKPNTDMSLAPPGYGAPAAPPQTVYPQISNDPGTPGAPAGVQWLVNAGRQAGPELGRGVNEIGQFLQFLSPKQGGPLAAGALPPDMSAPNPLMWGR